MQSSHSLAMLWQHAHVVNCVAEVSSRAVDGGIVAFASYGVAEEASPAVGHADPIGVHSIRIGRTVSQANWRSGAIHSKSSQRTKSGALLRGVVRIFEN
jgi:hypothetical protein